MRKGVKKMRWRSIAIIAFAAAIIALVVRWFKDRDETQEAVSSEAMKHAA